MLKISFGAGSYRIFVTSINTKATHLKHQTNMAKKSASIGALAGISTAAEAKKSNSTTKSTIEIQDSRVASAIDNFVTGKAALDKLTAQLKANESIIKEYGAEYAVDQLSKEKKFESVIFASKTNGILFITQDRPKMIKEDALPQIEAIVGENNVEVKTKLEMNLEVFEKYADKIAAALRNLDIPVEDKAKLITEVSTYEYTFGLNDIAKIAKEQEVSVQNVFSTFSPTLQLKVRGEKEK